MAISSPNPLEAYKKQAADRAVEFIESGMAVGLGTGSTAIFATRRLAELLRDGRLCDVVAIATSRATHEEAERLGIPLLADDLPRALDLTIDGADEVDPDMNLIKGGGGALLREKIIAEASRREIIVVDETKPSTQLGTHHVLPIEVLPFAWRSQFRFIERLGGRPVVRMGQGGMPFQTDSGNLILDSDFGPIGDPATLSDRLARRAGIVEHGLFIGLATDLIIAGSTGVSHRRRNSPPRTS